MFLTTYHVIIKLLVSSNSNNYSQINYLYIYNKKMNFFLKLIIGYLNFYFSTTVLIGMKI